jgi:hypothetical protein
LSQENHTGLGPIASSAQFWAVSSSSGLTKVYLGPGIPSYTFLVYYKDSSIVYIYIKKIFAYNYFKKILNYEKKTKIIGLKILKLYML